MQELFKLGKVATLQLKLYNFEFVMLLNNPFVSLVTVKSTENL